MGNVKIYDSLTRRKIDFEPLEPGRVSMYVCGITVYDYLHIGHARMLVAFDVVARHLRKVGYDVVYVRNITDIDDKIIRRANELGESIDAVNAHFIQAMHEDCAALKMESPTHEPRATDTVELMIDLIRRLESLGYAYAGRNGDVYYSVAKFEPYGRLSGKNVEDLRAGERVAIDVDKRDPVDFVLWKSAKPDEPSWDSPWGPGRPGWHIECSAMSIDLLGEEFDIHGGGADLRFPHHENEIAQSCAATGARFARLWMHNGFVQIDNEKMSKSLGNFFTVRDVLKLYSPEVVRMFLLAAHYRKPINYSDQELDSARAALERLYTALRGVTPGAAPAEHVARDAYFAAMNDDFNTPGALAAMFDLARELNRARDEGQAADAAELAALLVELGGNLGLLQDDPDTFLRAGGPQGAAGLADAEINALIAARDAARADKDWARSDAIRDQLAAQGIVLEDGSEGTVWRRA